MSLAEVLALVGAFGSIAAAVSVVYLALQTRAAVKSAELASSLAQVGALNRLTDLALGFDRLFVDQPSLRKYIYEYEDFVPLTGDDRARVLATAEYVLDFVENTLPRLAADSAAVPTEWRDYTSYLLRSSPVLRYFLAENGSWFDPRILEILRNLTTHGSSVMARRDGIEVVDVSGDAERSLLRPKLAAIYEASFPAAERADPSAVFDSADPGRRLLVIRPVGGTEALGFATILAVPGQRAFLLEYLAIDPGRKGEGLGGFLLTTLVGLARDLDADWVLAELEPTDSSSDADRRVRFYARHGWVREERLDYAMPDFTANGSLLLAMELHVARTTTRSPDYDLRSLVGSLYEVAYGDVGRPHARAIVDSVRA